METKKEISKEELIEYKEDLVKYLKKLEKSSTGLN